MTMNAALRRAALSVALLAGAAFVPALAQEVVGTLHTDSGTVMTSSGGKFETASQDQTLHVGDRVMIADGGKATFTYNSGLVLHYEEPGVYSVQLAPAASTGTATASGGSTAATIGVVLGAAALGAASLDSMDNVIPDHPVSQ
jgi:hypothetical protein